MIAEGETIFVKSEKFNHYLQRSYRDDNWINFAIVHNLEHNPTRRWQEVAVQSAEMRQDEPLALNLASFGRPAMWPAYRASCVLVLEFNSTIKYSLNLV